MLLSTPAPDTSFVAPDFSLVDVVTGETISLAKHDLNRGFVLLFICNHCPYVQAITDQLRETADTLQTEGIPVFTDK